MQLVGHTLQPMPLRQTVLWLHALELPRRFSTVNQSWCKVAVPAMLKSAPISDASVEKQPVLKGKASFLYES